MSRRTPTRHRAVRQPGRLRRALRKHVIIAAAAATATGGTLATGIATSGPGGGAAVAALVSEHVTAADPAATGAQMRVSRAERTSRSGSRTDVVSPKQEMLTRAAESGGQVTRTEDLVSGDPRTIAQAMLPEFGFSSSEFGCLDALWEKESGWDVNAANPTSSAYGIPQALPGSKMSSAGADWATNPATQIRWGLGYIDERYGSPCAAWEHSQANNWY